MRKLLIAALLGFTFAQVSFADSFGDSDMLSSKQCDMIASACKSAGFTSDGVGDQSFWFGCMKPVLYGKSVNGVTVDAKDVKQCRKAKIAKMKKELKALQAVK